MSDQWMTDILNRLGKIEDRILENEKNSAYHDTLIDRLRSVIREEVKSSLASVREDVSVLKTRVNEVEDDQQIRNVNTDWRRRIGSWVIAVVSFIAATVLTNLNDISKWFKSIFS